MALLMTVVGVVMLRLMHGQILAGDIVVEGHVSASDPRFWYVAGFVMASELVMLSISVTYLVTGHRYLPDLDPENGRPYLGLSLLTFAAIVVFGAVQRWVLPLIYG